MAESKKYEVSVTVETQYLADQSDPQDGRYVFAYHVGILNTGNIAAQLISRHWLIRDAESHVQEVRGLGVVGHQPLLKPGERFESSVSNTPAAASSPPRSAPCTAATRWWRKTARRSRRRSPSSPWRCRACCIERFALRCSLRMAGRYAILNKDNTRS